MLVDGVALGICGTDAEIVRGDYGEAPPGAERLILGHESLGRVAEAPEGSGFAPGDLVVGIVRRPDPEPCPSCAAGEWDFCRNGGYTERGIKALHGFGSERWRIEPEFAVKLDPGARDARRADGADDDRGQGVGADRPRSRSGRRSRPDACSSPAPARSGCWRRCSARSAGWRSTCSTARRTGPKPELVRDLGGHYFTGGVRDLDPPPDVIVEATGASQVVVDAMGHTAPNGIVCLTGHLLGRPHDPARRRACSTATSCSRTTSSSARSTRTAATTRRRRRALAAADRAWLERLITRRVPLDSWRDALTRQDARHQGGRRAGRFLARRSACGPPGGRRVLHPSARWGFIPPGLGARHSFHGGRRVPHATTRSVGRAGGARIAARRRDDGISGRCVEDVPGDGRRRERGHALCAGGRPRPHRLQARRVDRAQTIFVDLLDGQARGGAGGRARARRGRRPARTCARRRSRSGSRRADGARPRARSTSPRPAATRRTRSMTSSAPTRSRAASRTR